MSQTEKLLKEYNDVEKGAYIAAIASIATADKSASDEELEFLDHLSDSAELSSEQKESVRRAAKELTGEELKKCLDVLKDSELRYPLITDLMTFAEADHNYSPEEKECIGGIAQYLNINEQQFSLLNQFAKQSATAEAEPQAAQGILGSLGDQLKGAGIDIGSLTKGLLATAGPMILASLLRGRGSNANAGSGGLGGMLGGLLGGNAGGMLGGLLGGNAGATANTNAGGGGLGSLIGMLGGGGGLGNIGGLLSKVLKG